MYDRPSRKPERISAPVSTEAQPFEGLDKKTEKLLNRLSKRAGKIAIASALTATAVSSTSVAYWNDVRENQLLAASSMPSISEILPDENDQSVNSSTFYFAGFDTKNGDVVAARVGGAVQDVIGGSASSINYGDAPLDSKEIAQQIVNEARDDRLRNISLFGNSLGGIVSVDVADEIITNSDINVDTIFLNSTPDGTNGLKPSTQTELYTMLEWLNKLPGAQYSTAARYIGTLAQESGRFMDNGGFDLIKFIETSNYTIEQVKEQRRPGMWLMVDQALAITNANTKDALMNIGSQRGDKQMPSIVYLRPTDANDDTVVDVVESAENICKYAQQAGLNCSVYYVEGARHTSYLFNTEEYSATLNNAKYEILSNTQKEIAEHATDTYVDYLNNR